jgi:prevent-host-death family protein
MSSEVIALSELRKNPDKLLHQSQKSLPLLVIDQGEGVAVVQGLDDYEKNREELEFVKAVVQGLMEVRTGETLSLQEVQAALELTE